jgi:oligoendopeptidase F
MAGSEPPLPRWDIAAVYPSLDSSEFSAAKERLSALAAELLAHLEDAPAPASVSRLAVLGDWLARALELEDSAGSLYETLAAYAYASFATNTSDAAATAAINAMEEIGLSLKRAEVLSRNVLSSFRPELEALLEGPGADARIVPFAFHLREELMWQSRQMAPALEELAADLQRSGGDAWGRLQESVTSSASSPWDEGTAAGSAARAPARKTLVELRALAYDPDRATREKAYRHELELCKSIETPVAAALNGVKGFSISLNARRGWDASLDKSLEQARITRATLVALVGAMEESLPAWRRYLKAKARLLGLDRCAFFDIFAPLGRENGAWSFARARDFIVETFSSFDPAMGEFASRAFACSWIDAEPRSGKVGGAFCIDFPQAGASRILCNFDGSFGSMSTVAHELGHAWHAERVRGLPYVYTQYPMTLAETASIFAETLVFEGALKSALPDERTALLELHLQDACQVIVDILSRYYFESALFERREKAELAPAELCELMLEAQRRSYGEALEPGLLHPYMWLVKSHYYSTGLAFYNFPYAFGQLFGSALYARYEAEGPAFAAAYRGILESTGRASAVDVTAAAGFDIEKPDFWREGLAVFARLVDDLEAAAARPLS